MTKSALSDARLYAILDLSYIATGLATDVAKQLIAGGADVLQLRAKALPLPQITELAAQLHDITRAAAVPLIINDHPQVAAETGAEGVHVGQDDMSIAAARELAGETAFVGKSTHTLDQAQRAAEEGADYIGFGPLFATPTKPDYQPIGLDDIAKVHALVPVPIFCIGGIKLDNLERVIAAGAKRVVIVSGLLQVPDITKWTRRAKAMVLQNVAARYNA